jgi:uncharacterized protein (DUF983 family)
MQPVMTSIPPATETIRPLGLGMGRGAMFRCPNCGKGKLYRKYLKAQACPVCGHDNAAYPADDGPAYFTILIVGHLLIAPLLLFPWIWQAPTLLVVGTTLPALFILILAILPVVKGAVIGWHWSVRPRHEVQEP